MKKITLLFLSIAVLLILYSFSELWLSWLGFLSPEKVTKETGTMIQSYTSIVALLLTMVGLFYQLKGNKNSSEPTSPQEQISAQSLLQDPDYEATPLDTNIEIDLEKSPYLGLSAFKPKDQNLFFGRRKEIKEALQSFNQSCRWLQVEGNSGAGKSSLVNAGILPEIKSGKLATQTGYQHWKIINTITPGETPLRHLAEALEQTFIEDPAQRDTLARQQKLEADERALSYMLSDLKADNNITAFVLFVDQFEELFTFSAKQEKQQFDTQISHALKDKNCPLFLITTVRIDFLEGFEQLPKLSELYNHYCKRYLLKTISLEGLKEAIINPAKLANLDVSEVTTAILQDAQNEVGALPLVENALQTLWLESQNTNNTHKLSGEIYHKKGGLVGLLETQADQLLNDLDNKIHKGKQAALELLLALTRRNDEGRHTRRNLPVSEACSIAGGKKSQIKQGQEIIDYLTGRQSINNNGRLFLLTTLGNREENQQISIIHETLIRARGKDKATGKLYGYWKTLYNYIEKNRDRGFYRDQLSRQAKIWDNSKGLKRWGNLAGWSDLKNYRPLRLDKDSIEARFKVQSKIKTRLYTVLATLFIGFWGESYVWTLNHGFQPNYMLMQQKFRLMNWGLMNELIPTDNDFSLISVSKEPFQIGELDEGWIEKNIKGTEFEKNFGYPKSNLVNINKPFYMGKYEVTYAQYDYYVWQQQGAENPPEYPSSSPNEGQRGNRAVAYVSWNDVNGYLQWLSVKTGEKYRLPTEVEWEYSARAKSKTANWWGDSATLNGKVQANCEGCGSEWDNKRIAPVGQFEPNDFGLYDTAGNVWEWTASMWQNKFDGSENKVVDSSNKSGRRVIRGGSWLNETVWLRSSARGGNLAGNRVSNVGFRLYRSPRTN